MEIRILCFYILITSVLTPYVYSKPFSLNDIIAAEKATQPEESIFEHPIVQGKKIASSRYKKSFRIKSPSRPKKLKHLQRPRQNRRKKLTSKREIHQNEKHNKYIPLLKNIGMLFDNILNSDSSETYDTRKYKRNQFNTKDSDKGTCTCVNTHDSEDKSYSQEETFTTPSTLEVQNETLGSAIITTTPTYNFANDNISSIGYNKNIPLLFTRDSFGLRGNDNRFSKRNGSSHNGGFKGHIAEFRRNNKYTAIDRKGQLDTEYNEEYSDSHSRNNKSSHEPSGGIRGISRNFRSAKLFKGTNETKEFILPTNESIEDFTRIIPEYERDTEFEIRRNQTESPIFLPEFNSRLRETNTQEKGTSTRITKSEKNYDDTSNKRVVGRNGSFADENKEDCRTDKAIIPIFTSNSTTHPVGKVVMIFDGYSVASDVNGENKRKERAIHIHS